MSGPNWSPRDFLHDLSVEGRAVREILPFAIFYALYTMGTCAAIGFEQGKGLGESKLVVYLTSPFSAIENIQSSSTPFTYRLLENFLLVALIMALVAGYNLFLSRGRRSPSLPLLFSSAVASTYFLSLGEWVSTGTPASGTSVIASSLLAYLAFACIREVWSEVKSGFEGGRSVLSYDALLWTALTAVMAFMCFCYVLGNQSGSLHLVGAVLTGLVVGLASYLA